MSEPARAFGYCTVCDQPGHVVALDKWRHDDGTPLCSDRELAPFGNLGEQR